MTVGKQLIIYGTIALLCSLVLGRYVFSIISGIVIIIGVIGIIGENTSLPGNNRLSKNTELPPREENTDVPLRTSPAIRFCRSCGKELELGAKICRHCGAKMDDQT